MSEIRNFKLGTILTVTTGYNLTKDNNIDDVYELYWFIHDDEFINGMGIGTLKAPTKNHLLTIHPELKEVKFKKGHDVNKFVLKQEKKFGEFLPVTRLGEALPSDIKQR